MESADQQLDRMVAEHQAQMLRGRELISEQSRGSGRRALSMTDMSRRPSREGIELGVPLLPQQLPMTPVPRPYSVAQGPMTEEGVEYSVAPGYETEEGVGYSVAQDRTEEGAGQQGGARLDQLLRSHRLGSLGTFGKLRFAWKD